MFRTYWRQLIHNTEVQYYNYTLEKGDYEQRTIHRETKSR